MSPTCLWLIILVKSLTVYLRSGFCFPTGFVAFHFLWAIVVWHLTLCGLWEFFIGRYYILCICMMGVVVSGVQSCVFLSNSFTAWIQYALSVGTGLQSCNRTNQNWWGIGCNCSALKKSVSEVLSLGQFWVNLVFRVWCIGKHLD